MAKTYPCDNGCGNTADINLHFISTTNIQWLCPECFNGAMLAFAASQPEDVLLAVGLMKATAAPVTEDGSAEAPAERPQPDPDGDEDEDEGPDGAPEAGPAGADAGDPRGDHGVPAGPGDGGESAPAGATA